MTKLMEQVIAIASTLPPEEQDLLAARWSAALDLLKDDGPVPESHKRFLDERAAARDRSPGTAVPYEEVMNRLAARERKTAAQAIGSS